MRSRKSEYSSAQTADETKLSTATSSTTTSVLENSIPIRSSKLVDSRFIKNHIINVSDMTLWRWVKSGVIPPPVYVGRRRYWRLGQLLDAFGIDN